MNTADLARERAGRRRPGESVEDYEARVAAFLPRAERVHPTTPDAIAAVNERRQRAGITKAGG